MADHRLLYYITDRSQLPGDESARRRALLDKIVEAADAGVDYIQLREKDLSARELESLTRQAVAAVRANSPSTSTRLLVNARTDVALAAGADGVHLPAADVSPSEVRQVLEVSGNWSPANDHFLIAVSCHSNQEVMRAESEGVDFAVFAPLFGKNKFPGAQPKGVTALRQACQAKIPILALGGVTVENAASCLNAGAAGVAGIRLFQENAIQDVVRLLRGL